jgi:hypothetical protein
MKKRANPSINNTGDEFRKHASLRILQDQIYKDKGQLIPLDTLREMVLKMGRDAHYATFKVVEGGKRRANPATRDAAATAVAFLRKYGSQALGWAKTAASIHRGLRDRIFWRKVYNCILRSLKRGDPLPNPRRMMSNPGPDLKKAFVLKTFLGPVYRFSGKGLRHRGRSQCDGVGGYHRRAGYAFIPGDEIWIEKMADGVTEERYLLGHEMMEILVMRVRKWGYQKAHDAITPFELRLRKEECPEKVFRAYIAKFFPKATPTGARMALAGLMHGYRRYR